jgi:hypothetical protein
MPDERRPDTNPNDSDIEATLRRALAARADAVEPKETNVSDLEARADDSRRRTQRRRTWLAAAAVVLLIAGVVGVLALGGDDGEDDLSTEPPETTTTTEQETTTTSSTTSTTVLEDDGVLGWPGLTSRVFDNPEAAVLAFATDVLGFAEPTISESSTGSSSGGASGSYSDYVVHPRPTAGVSTSIRVHDTGPIRGWVVTGTKSDQGTIDEATLTDPFTISGSATAFEATLSVFVVDQEGNVLAETTTMAGANGEQGPYTAEIDVDTDAGTPFWIMIGEADASGEGRLVWATTYDLFAGAPG